MDYQNGLNGVLAWGVETPCIKRDSGSALKLTAQSVPELMQEDLFSKDRMLLALTQNA